MKYVLDYPNINDRTAFLDYVKHDDAMAEIYFDDETEQLSHQTEKLFESSGKRLHHNTHQCDLMLVLRENEKIIGFIELRLTKDPHMMSQLFSLFVDKNHRLKGLANLMMFYSLDFFVNSNQTTLTVSPTAESLVVYNKFAFYPPDTTEEKDLAAWFKQTEKTRLEHLQDSPSEYLVMNLESPSCYEAFKKHCDKTVQNFPKHEISQRLATDLTTDVFNWRKKSSASLTDTGLSVLNTEKTDKKRKFEAPVVENEQNNTPCN